MRYISCLLSACLISAGYASQRPLWAEQTTAQNNDAASLAPVSPLDKEPALATKVSFEAKQQPLRALLSDLQKQSGVKLEAVDGFGTQFRVTARVKDMALSSVMGALSRLYQADWLPINAKSYTFKPPALSVREKQLSQIGDLHWFRFRDNDLRNPSNRIRRGNALAQEIQKQIAAGALKSATGVPMSALSAESQEALRLYLGELLSKDIVANNLYALAVQKQNLALRLEVPADIKAQMKNARPGVTQKIVPSVSLYGIYDGGETFICAIPLESSTFQTAPTTTDAPTPVDAAQ